MDVDQQKKDNRKGKVQLIDASQAFEKLRKNQGSRNCTIEPYRTDILRVYTASDGYKRQF